MTGTLGLICCRGGSKGIPQKNIKPLAGKPLLGWTLEQAKASAVCDDLACSSDDQKILDVARNFGANILINRPSELATDQAGALPTILHALDEAEKQSGKTYEWLVYMQVTSPLRLPSDISDALHMAKDKGAGSVISGYPAKTHVMVERTENGNWDFMNAKGCADAGRRQDAEKWAYALNGALYVWHVPTFRAGPKLLYPTSEIFEMPESRSVDIDEPWQFDMAEILIKRLCENG